MLHLHGIIQIDLFHTGIRLHFLHKTLLRLRTHIDAAVRHLAYDQLQKRTRIHDDIFDHHAQKHHHQREYQHRHADRYVMLDPRQRGLEGKSRLEGDLCLF